MSESQAGSALVGRFGPQQRYLVATMLAYIDALDATLAELSDKIAEQMRPFEDAQAASRARNTYLAAQFHRLAARRGKKKAAVAVAHSILIAAYHLLTRSADYHDLGGDYFDRRDQDALERRLVRRLEAPGNKVTLEKAG